ncbi:MAG: hypothetical protein WC366_02235 [Bacilli bacterium]
MKISLDEKSFNIAKKYLEAKESNMSAAELYIEYLTHRRDAISTDSIERYFDRSIESAFYQSFVDEMSIDENDLSFSKMKDWNKISDIKELYKKDFQSNPYYRNIRLSNAEMKNRRLTNLSYLPYEGFVYDEIVVDSEDYYIEKTPLGFYPSQVSYPALLEDDTIWMSVIPHEINTMKMALEKVRGNVLIYGLGLGYFAYMASIKNDVDAITIIENDSDIIALFKKQIFNKFTYRNKISIINEDAFEWAAKIKDGEYDYVFADIWHNVGDGIAMYLKLKKYEQGKNTTKFLYWIETSLLSMFRRQVLSVFEEQINGFKENDYLKAKNENDIIINKLYFYLKDYSIKDANDLKNLLSDESLKNIAKNLNY